MTTATLPAISPAADAEHRHQVARVVAGQLWRGLCYGLLGLSLAVTAATIVVPKLVGAVPLTVLSDSMAPGMPAGSLAVVRPTMNVEDGQDVSTMDAAAIDEVNHVDELAVGDVIVYQPDANDGTAIMHRITGISVKQDGARQFTTKGDNNDVADSEPVDDHMVRGEVWYHLPYLGYVNDFLNSGESRHRIAVVTIAVIGYGWAVICLARAARRRR